MSNKLKQFKMIDPTDSFTTDKDRLFSLPMRLLFIAKTGDSKSSTLSRFLLDDNFYRDDFLPENIFIFSGSVKGDYKLSLVKRELDIPDENVIGKFDEDLLEIIYDMLVENYNEKVTDGIKEKKELNSLIIFDDLAYSGAYKADGKGDILTKIFMNGRKFLISTIVIAQKYSSLGTNLRENSSGLIIGKSSNKQVKLIADDHNYIKGSNHLFTDLFRKTTEKPYSKFIINFSHPNLYQNQDFEDLI